MASLHIASHFPGRLRVRAEAFRDGAFAGDVATQVRAEAGVVSAQAFPRTGSLLVEYRASELQLPQLIDSILRIGGLDGVAADRGPPSPPLGDAVRAAFARCDEWMLEATRGRADARAAVPGALAGLGVLTLLFGNRRAPEWYDLLFWSFVTFTNLNPPRGEDGPQVVR